MRRKVVICISTGRPTLMVIWILGDEIRNGESGRFNPFNHLIRPVVMDCIPVVVSEEKRKLHTYKEYQPLDYYKIEVHHSFY
jgi:hypothetical protein